MRQKPYDVVIVGAGAAGIGCGILQTELSGRAALKIAGRQALTSVVSTS